MQRFLALVLLLGSACSAPSLAVLPRGGNFEPDGDFELSGDAGGLALSASNSVEALGLVEDDGVPGLRADLGWGGLAVTIAWQQSEHGGTGTLEAEVSDDDVSIPAGTDVDSEFDMGLGELLLTFDLLPGELFTLGIGLGATVFDLDVSVTDSLSGDTVDPEAETFLAPLLALRAGVHVGPLDVEALLGGMDLSYDGDEASLYDLDLMARLNLLGSPGGVHGALIAGYRLLDLEVDYADDSGDVVGDVDFSGPYVGLSFGL